MAMPTAHTTCCPPRPFSPALPTCGTPYRWALELLRRRDHAQFALRAAVDDVDTAYGHLTSAQRDGDPRKIATAHAALERAIKDRRTSAEASRQVRRTMQAELDLLAHAARDHAVTALVRQMGRDRSAIIAQALNDPGTQERPPEPVAAPSGSRPRWLRRPATRRTIGLEQP
jgi:hypothetical protein